MTDQRKQIDADDPKALAELGCVPMSNEALKKMTLNPYDQLFICRLMTMRDEAAKDEMATALAEVVAAQNRMLFNELGEQTTMIKNMAVDVAHIKTTLVNVEKRLGEAEIDILLIKKKIGMLERKVKSLEKDHNV